VVIRGANVQRAALDPRLQRLTLVEGHRDEQLVVPIADLIDCCNVRVIERACGLRFENETCARVWIVCDCRRQEFQRDLSLKPRVFGEIHHAHATHSDGMKDTVMRDGFSNHGHHQPRGSDDDRPDCPEVP